MEIIEYFFGNFWHFLELLLCLEVIFSGGLVRFIKIDNKVDNTDKEQEPKKED